MSYQLNFSQRAHYDAREAGITIATILRYGNRVLHRAAKIDTGAQYCLFSREIGEDLGLQIESGLRKEMNTLSGSLITYGHEVTMETLGLEFQSFVFFAAEKGLPRNLLGRVGWLQLVRLAVIDYEQELYLALYNETA